MAFKVPDQIVTVVLDPNEWERGNGASCLLEAGGRMCCWGFAALALGATKREIRDKAAIDCLDHVFAARVREAGQYDINDTPNGSEDGEYVDDVDPVTDAERVRLLNENAEKHGIPVRFALKAVA